MEKRIGKKTRQPVGAGYQQREFFISISKVKEGQREFCSGTEIST